MRRLQTLDLGPWSSTYHWKVAVLFSKTWKVIILKSFQNIMQVIYLEIKKRFSRVMKIVPTQNA